MSRHGDGNHDLVELQYCTSDGASIAYADFGGPGPPIVFHTETSVEAKLTAAFERPWMELLRRLGRLIMVDLRGCGGSDRMDPDRPPSPERRVDDLATVLDAIGAPTVTMVGILHGASSLALFAARHPHRVDRLVLLGPYVRLLDTGDRAAEADEQFEDLLASLSSEWGHGWHVPRHAPGRVGDEVFRRDWARVERMTGTPGAIAMLLRAFREVDLRPVLHQVTAPTLVLERRQFGLIAESAGRDVASRIPAATYVELDAVRRRRRCCAQARTSASTSAPVSTRARSRCEARTSEASPSTSLLVSAPSPPAERSSSRGPSRTSSPDSDFGSRSAATTSSRASRARGASIGSRIALAGA